MKEVKEIEINASRIYDRSTLHSLANYFTDQGLSADYNYSDVIYIDFKNPDQVMNIALRKKEFPFLSGEYIISVSEKSDDVTEDLMSERLEIIRTGLEEVLEVDIHW